jgi:hypothetical protein
MKCRACVSSFVNITRRVVGYKTIRGREAGFTSFYCMNSLSPSIEPTAQPAPESPEATPRSGTSPTPPAPTTPDHEESGADPEPSTAPVDPDGDTDPGASNTGDVHPL